MTATTATPGRTVRPGMWRTEQVILVLLTLLRVGALTQMVLIVWSDAGHGRATTMVLSLGAGLLAESLVLLGLCWRGRAVAGRWILADTALCALLLALGAALANADAAASWARAMTPLVLVTFAGLGLAMLRARTVVAAMVALAGTVVVTAVLVYHVAVDDVVYLSAFTVVARIVARELRIAGRALETGRLQALTRAGQLAREQERARQARLLHDRVLQTLEVLARPGITIDDRLRDHIAAEAAWLRAHITGDAPQHSGDLSAALSDLVERKTRTGMHIDSTAAGLTGTDAPTLPAATVEAVVGAVGEALTNVAKHAGTESAVLHVTTENGMVVVSVLDHGRGFDTAAGTPGRLGLTRSIRSRIAEVGGTVTIDSTPGAGTHVELRVPTAPARDSLPVARPEHAVVRNDLHRRFRPRRSRVDRPSVRSRGLAAAARRGPA